MMGYHTPSAPPPAGWPWSRQGLCRFQIPPPSLSQPWRVPGPACYRTLTTTTAASQIPFHPSRGGWRASWGAVSGGHRKGTHSILGLVAFWAIAYFSASISYNGIPWASPLLAAFSGGLALRVLGAPVDGLVPLRWVMPPTRQARLRSSPGLSQWAPRFTLSVICSPPAVCCLSIPSSSNHW